LAPAPLYKKKEAMALLGSLQGAVF